MNAITLKADSLTAAHRLAGCTFFALSLALSARVALPLPFTPVPVTLQTMLVLLAGLVLGPRWGALAMVEYISMGMMGLPVFAGGGAGPAWLLGPTGGYLAGFVPAAWMTGAVAAHLRGNVGRGAAVAAGTLVIYACGTAWLATWLAAASHVPAADALTRAVQAGVAPFLLADALKAALAAGVTASGKRFLGLLR